LYNCVLFSTVVMILHERTHHVLRVKSQPKEIEEIKREFYFLFFFSLGYKYSTEKKVYFKEILKCNINIIYVFILSFDMIDGC